MQAIIFCGIQASGKSTFYQRHFFQTHVRISLDLLRTRHRERQFLSTCLTTRQKFVVDNTNPTVAERAVYISAAKAAGFEVAGYFFDSPSADAILRNNQREGKQRIPDVGIYGTNKRLQKPIPEEGFNVLYRVTIHNGEFVLEQFHPEHNP